MATWLTNLVRSGPYDEAAVLEEYLRHNYARLMTRFETIALKAMTARDGTTLRTMAQMAAIQYPHEDPEVVKAITIGQEPFLKRVFERIWRDDRSKIVVNRCPKCSRIAASPIAAQCLWCHHEWHCGDFQAQNARS